MSTVTGLWVGRSSTLPMYGTVNSTGISRKAHCTLQIRGQVISDHSVSTLNTDNSEDQNDEQLLFMGPGHFLLTSYLSPFSLLSLPDALLTE